MSYKSIHYKDETLCEQQQNSLKIRLFTINFLRILLAATITPSYIFGNRTQPFCRFTHFPDFRRDHTLSYNPMVFWFISGANELLARWPLVAGICHVSSSALQDLSLQNSDSGLAVHDYAKPHYLSVPCTAMVSRMCKSQTQHLIINVFFT